MLLLLPPGDVRRSICSSGTPAGLAPRMPAPRPPERPPLPAGCCSAAIVAENAEPGGVPGAGCCCVPGAGCGSVTGAPPQLGPREGSAMLLVQLLATLGGGRAAKAAAATPPPPLAAAVAAAVRAVLPAIDAAVALNSVRGGGSLNAVTAPPALLAAARPASRAAARLRFCCRNASSAARRSSAPRSTVRLPVCSMLPTSTLAAARRPPVSAGRPAVASCSMSEPPRDAPSRAPGAMGV